MFFRTKAIKGGNLVQLVESYRNLEGRPRQRVAVSLPTAPGSAAVLVSHSMAGRAA